MHPFRVRKEGVSVAQQTVEPSAQEQLVGAAPEAGISQAVVGKTPRQLFWRRFRKDTWAIAGGVFSILMILLAIFGAPLASKLLGHGVDEQFLYEMTNEFGQPRGPTLGAPLTPEQGSGIFLFGADGLGRDMVVRILYGARTSLLVALMATVIELVIGVSLGLIAGFYRGKVDTLISRTTDVFLTLPVLLLAIGLGFTCGARPEGCLGGLIKPGMFLVAAIIGLFSWPYLSRIVRGQVLSIREKEYVESARALGASNRRIISRDVLTNVLAPIIVYTTLIIPTNILFEAALSFLGVGVPAQIPSWGRMLDEASEQFDRLWWLMLFPGLFLFATTLAFNLFGDGLRDAFDPKSSR
jgi:ABC-type dipeptide/oligopeptide/nickel transport system permease subunit